MEGDSQQQKLDLLMEERSIISQLFEPDTIDVSVIVVMITISNNSHF